MLRGSFQPHALASSGRSRRCVCKHGGEVVDHLGVHLVRKPVEPPGDELVDPAVQKPPRSSASW